MKYAGVVIAGILFSTLTLGQTITRQTFSLVEAQQYAVTNSPIMKNANIDLEMAKKKIWETTAIGLPHVSGKVSGSYMLELSPTTEQFSALSSLGLWMYGADQALAGITKNPAFGNIPDPGNPEQIDEQDLKWGATFDLTVSQLVFSGAYLVGLQTTKVFKGLSELAITKSKKDIEESISNSYYLVLVMQENKAIMNSMYEQMLKTVKEMEALYKSGFVEETAVDQIKLTANTIKNSLIALDNQVEVAKNLLRFQMGYPVNIEIVLTNSLQELLDQNINLSLLSESFTLSKNTDYKLIQTQTELKELQVKYQKSMLLPDIAAFYQYDYNFNENAMSFTPPQILGASINIPIFGSGDKAAKISQAKLDLAKQKNTEMQISEGLQVSFKQAQSSYNNAINKLEANKTNMDLSQKIYDKTFIKFKNGISTSMELTQAQQQLLQAQSSYYTTVIELVNAKNSLEKLLK